MKRTTVLMATLIVGALVALSAGVLAQSRADVALRAAIETETVKGDLKAAIEQYKALASGPDRTVAAKALVRLGECYQKQGNVESSKVWERVVREFADQKEAAAAARARLAAIAAPSATDVEIRRLSLLHDERGYGASVSRDGRLLTYLLGGGIYLHDTVTGEERQVVPKGPGPGQPSGAHISPDGKRIAWLNVGDGEPAIYVADSDGRGARLLAAGPGALCGWSPDGREVLRTIATSGASPQVREVRLERVSVSDASSKVVATGADCGRFSPDGRYIAFQRRGSQAAAVPGISVVGSDGVGETAVLDDTNASFPLWTPDGRHVLFSRLRRDSSGSSSRQDLWSIPVGDGKPAGSAALLKEDVPRLLGVSQDGTYYYQRRYTTRDVYSLDVDAQTGAMSARPKQVTSDFDNGGAAWSPDGSSLAYLSRRNQETLVVFRSVRTSQERQLPVKGLPPIGLALQWFPDGRSLLLHASNRRFYRVDMESGESQPFLGTTTFGDGVQTWAYKRWVSLSPDGQTVYFGVGDAQSGQAVIFRKSVADGVQFELGRVPAGKGTPGSAIGVSPDGRQLALVVENSLWRVAAAGGDQTKVWDVPGTESRAPAWSGDGRRLFVPVITQRGGQRRCDLWSVPVDGGKPQQSPVALHDMYSLSLSPDGKTLLFMDEDYKNELWVIKNLFPAPKTGK